MFFLNFPRIILAMKKIIIASLLGLSLLIPVAAEKVTVDYNKLAESGTET